MRKRDENFFNYKKFKTLRTSRGLLQEDIANKCDVTKQVVSKWENGKSNPAARNIKKLCSVLGCRVSELFNMPELFEVEEDRRLINDEHFGADVYDDIRLMESLEVELSMLNTSDPDYTTLRNGFEHQIILCREEIERKTQEAKQQYQFRNSVSANGNSNTVEKYARSLTADANPYGDNSLTPVESFRNSLIMHFLGLDDIPEDIRIRIMQEIKEFRKEASQ